jgi:hypothetical protein
MWNAVLSYAEARWAEPETKLAVTTAVATTVAALLGHWGVITPTVSLKLAETTDIACVVTALLPGPISSAILKQIFGANVPPTAALRYHAAMMQQHK